MLFADPRSLVLMHKSCLKFLLVHSRNHAHHYLLNLRGEIVNCLRLKQVSQGQVGAEHFAHAEDELRPEQRMATK